MTVSTVFRVGWDVDRFQAFLWDMPQPGDAGLFSFNGTPRLDRWTPQPVYSDQPRLERPDLWQVIGAAGIAMNSEVLEALEPFVSSAGEILPIVVSGSGAEMFLLNVLIDIDCLDPSGISPDTLEIYADFLEHRLPESGFFKLPQLDVRDIFVLERDDDADSIRRRIASRGLTGVELTPVWSSDNSLPRVNLLLKRK